MRNIQIILEFTKLIYLIHVYERPVKAKDCITSHIIFPTFLQEY